MSVTANQQRKPQGCKNGNEKVAASTYLYLGTLAFYNVSGYLDDDTGLGNNTFAGITSEEVDNSGGANGDERCEFEREGVFYLKGTGFSQASVGQPVFALDNFTVTTDPTAAGAVSIGMCCQFVSSTEIGVDIDPDAPDFLDYAFTITPHASITARNLHYFREPMRLVHSDMVPNLVHGSALTGTLVKATGTATPSSGTTPLHTANALDFNAAAQTIQPVTLTSTVADLLFAPGDRLALVTNAALSTGHATISCRFRRK